MNLHYRLRQAIPLGKLNRNARLFLTAAVVDGIINSTWSLYFNFFILSRGFDKEFMGLANAIPSIASVLVGLPMGMLSDRIGRRKAMQLGLIILGLGYGLQVLMPSPAMILLMGFIGGAGSSLYVISQAPFMMHSSNNETRALLFSLSSGVLTLSGALGNLVAGQLPSLLSSMTGWTRDGFEVLRIIMLAAVLLGTFSLIPISLIKEDREDRQEEKVPIPQKPLKDLLKRGVLWKLSIPNVLIGIGAGILMPYLNVFYVERFHLQDKQLGVLFSLSSLLIGLASLIGPRLAVLLKGKIRTVVVTQGLSFVFLVVMGFSPAGWISQAAYLIRSMLMNMASPLYSAFSMEQFSLDEQGKANSIMNNAWTIGWAFGPYISGLIQQKSGFNPLFIITTTLYALSTLIVWIVFGKPERAEVKKNEMMALAPAEPLFEKMEK